MAAPGSYGPPGSPYGPPGPGSLPPGHGGGPPVSPQQRAAAVRRARGGLLLGIGAALLAVPLAPAGAVLGVLAVARSVSAARLLARANLPQTPAVLGIVGGAVALLIGLAITGTGLWLRAEIGRYQDCMGAANTRIAEQACRDRLEDDLFERLSRWTR